jgi:Nucleotidyltransferase domain
LTPVQSSALERILPHLADNARAGTITAELAVDVIQRATAAQFPAAVHVFACGSSLNGTARPYSDIDVVVTLAAPIMYERRCFVFDGYPVDIQAIGLPSIRQAVAKARSARLPFLLKSIATAKIVTDRDGRAAQLQALVARHYHAGPPAADARAIDLLRLATTELLLDLCTLQDHDDKVATGLSLYHPLMNLLLPADVGWLHTGKHIPREMGKRGSARFQEVSTAYKSLFAGEPDPLITLTLTVLDLWGGPLWDGATQSAAPREPPLPAVSAGQHDPR